MEVLPDHSKVEVPHLRYGGSDDEPRLLPHGQEVVAEQHGVFLLVARQQCQELLQETGSRSISSVPPLRGWDFIINFNINSLYNKRTYILDIY